MNNKNNLKFKKKTNNKLNESTNPQPKNEKIIRRLMEKYNLTQDEAIETLIKIEEKKNKNNNKTPKESISPFQTFGDYNNTPSNDKPNSLKKRNPQTETLNTEKNGQNINHNTEISNKLPEGTSSQNVNSIIENMFPTYEKHATIEVNNVDLTFKITPDKIDTLKELFIRTVTRKKNKVIELHALKNISFKIYNGEKVGVIGYNGAGKSTLLNVITGIYPPDSGEVKTFGKISPLLSLGAGFDYNYSGRNNIYLNGAILGYEKDFLKEKEKEIIEFSELEEFIDFPIKNYSSGMLAKLGFSIATAVEPDILIIDEILGVGDVNFQKKCADKIRSLMDSGTTVILVSHSIPQIRELCDKAIWIDNGRLKEIGEVNEVCDNYLKDAEKASRDQLANIKFK